MDATSGETFPDFNPTTGKIFAKIPKADAADAERAMSAAYSARRDWANTPFEDRSEFIHKASELLQRNPQKFTDVLIEEGGSTLDKAIFETTYTADLLRAAAEDFLHTLAEMVDPDHDKHATAVCEPIGTVVVISSWDSPLLVSANKVAYALAAGNTVVLKPSSETPAIALKIAELFEKVGLPAGVLNVVTSPDSVVEDTLVDDDRTSFITFTGDISSGRRLAQKAAAKLKKYALEFSGKDPLIILGDADLDYAVDAAAWGAFMHNTQIYMSVKRLIVEAPIAEEFGQRLAEKAKSLRVGDPRKPGTSIGPMINEEQIKKVHSQVNDAVSKGARLLTGGSYKGRFYKPTVLSDVTQEMRVFTEQAFGPLAPIMAVKDEYEALAVANDSTGVLSANLITKDLKRAMVFAENLDSDMVYIDDASAHDSPYYPFAWCKRGGPGGEGARRCMKEMIKRKWMVILSRKSQSPHAAP